MTNPSREDVLCLLDDVVLLRQKQPAIIQDMYVDSTLVALRDVKFVDGPKLTQNTNFPNKLPCVNLDMSQLEEMEGTLIDQLQILRILCAKKNRAISKTMKNS